MSKGKSASIFQIFKKNEFLLVLILVIAGVALSGWLSGAMILTSYSKSYIPIAPANIVMISILTIIFLINIKFSRHWFQKYITCPLVLIILLFCLIVFIQFFFNLPSDIENAFLKNPERFGTFYIGRMSPITAVLYIFICIGYLGTRLNISDTFRYIGGGLSLTAFFVSVVLLIGYLYSAPLLYGGKIIPVSLPSAICFNLFSYALLKVYELKFFSFENIVENKVTRLLLKSFLPIVILISIIQGFLDAVFPFNDKNPPLTSAIILFIVVAATSFIVYRVSALIGNQLLMAEKLLEESEDKFRSILENSSDAIFIANPKGEFLYTNRAVIDMLGYQPDELKKMNFQIIARRQAHDYFGIFKQILSRGNAFDEIELLKKDGTFIPIEVNTFLLPEGNIFGNCKDISERKIAQKALIESDTKYRLIADYNFDWEFWITNEKKFRYNSPSCEKISGYKPSDFKSDPDLFFKIIHPDDLIIYENHLSALNENITCPGIDYRIITRSGEVRWINHVCQPVYSGSGDNLGRRGSNSDITSRKIAEDLIQQLNRRLKKLNTDKDRFISILGHDLRSPFTSLLGFSEILMNEVHSLNINEIELIASNINKSALNTFNLLDDLLKWANSQQGKIPFNPQILSLPVVCWDVLKTLNPLAESKNITINYARSEELKFVADSEMVKTVLRNLISNAIKFTNTGGLVSINAEKYSGKVIISVQDNGVGISRESLAKLFDISQVLTTKGTSSETGTGLGLLICKEFVENHGGTIWAESVQGEGSTFRFSLPESQTPVAIH